MLNALLKKLIRAGAGRTRFALAITGLSIALLLILSAVQIQANYNSLLHGKTNQDSIANFLVINKKITAATIGTSALSDAEIAALKSQPFVDALGQLTPSRFKVAAQGATDNIPFYTDLFFESVPDEFLDVTGEAWQWNEQSQFIPMVIPNMFLDLYNFGFAASQNLPQLTQDLVKSLPVKISIQTPAGMVSYYAKVAGFSDRISSVLVPQQFMDWANKKFGNNQPAQSSRVVIKTKDPGSPLLVQYLQDHGLTTDADKTRFSKYRQVVDMVVRISWITGAIMLLFALLIFTLFIQLTIASCREEIVLLITLGTTPRQLYRFLMHQFFPANVLITAVTLVLLGVLQWQLSLYLHQKSIHVPVLLSLYTLATAGLVLLVLWLVNRSTIRKYIAQA